ncbi:hypothetical protein Pmar_PMAR018623 [Perkinsus marinus ATCC 50983]|uniref:Phosphoribulokinase/uridine kinase domain-containing protein n=1 Tax=Perkinsus marinus (strain ATCC 50983 / TXsc) TaxID=423536 RepID=C5L0C0_PERM5|nr:hypothetical protein Pmar_PMAR018623 [Perkinsus marinus ATCC 50983]EER09978.1 hypothetical protein Pmar_PMAR018623 [Perkinsus marinus ATCC 50983]|eukprot:XP_002778183.1 hypothetical protein Pmar_PMAR018623 [Perkinsus marinus ATCC 50983]
MSGASSILLSPSRQPVASPGSTIKQISANAPVFDGAESLELPEAVMPMLDGVEENSTTASSSDTTRDASGKKGDFLFLTVVHRYSREYAESFVIGVAGASAAGKTSLCAEIMRRLGVKKVL